MPTTGVVFAPAPYTLIIIGQGATNPNHVRVIRAVNYRHLFVKLRTQVVTVSAGYLAIWIVHHVNNILQKDVIVKEKVIHNFSETRSQ